MTKPIAVEDFVPLNPHNQVAPRSYNRLVLCFGIDNDKKAEAIAHLKTCTSALGQTYPVLRSLLKVEEPVALVSPASHNEIPVEVYDIENTFGQSYVDLKLRGFPASAFVNDIFGFNSHSIAHAIIIRIYLIEGGLILGLHLHHSLGDGHAMNTVARWFSAQTRGAITNSEPVHITKPPCDIYYGADISKSDLVRSGKRRKRIPERKLLTPAYTSPPTEECTGKVFLFDAKTLSALQDSFAEVNKTERPSSTVVLAALMWAHATKARLGTCKVETRHTDKQPRLFITVDIRKRAFGEIDQNGYFGNATEMPFARIEVCDLLRACHESAEDGVTVAENLYPVVQCIQEAIKQVDVRYAAERQELYVALSDPTKLVFDIDFSDKYDFVFNSWRYIGTGVDQKWSIPGVRSDYPDSFRRAGDAWNCPAAVILPTAPDSRELELMITLEERAMELLLEDEEFMKYTRLVSH
ncbi:hypothetical protein GGR57DRAFT_469142 [Xylariaceae sp. FL1272]|nr:hypothetical protein GGR57DRAFT_469142 [Xylariaceae sp. FL1272]